MFYVYTEKTYYSESDTWKVEMFCSQYEHHCQPYRGKFETIEQAHEFIENWFERQ
jgi:hypothetical protein